MIAPRRYALLGGGRSLRGRKNPERKVRTPQGSPPCESKGALNESSLRRKVSQKTNRFAVPYRRQRSVGREARVKRRGKSPPPQAQARGHDKPCAVQDKTEGMGRLPEAPATGDQPSGTSRGSQELFRRFKTPEQDK